MAGFNMDDYVPVNERIEAFKKDWPDGSLQSEIVELNESRVTVKAYAYRTPDDTRPGIGHSSVEIPGRTPYTKGSEIENAETSAWGRAIVALGFETKRGIASQEEVRNKQPGQGNTVPSGGAKSDERDGATTPTPAPAQYRRAELAQLASELDLSHKDLEDYAAIIGITPGQHASNEQMDRLIEAVRGHGTDAVIEQPEAGSAHPAPADTLGLDEAGPDPDEDAGAYKAWFDALPRERRATLRSQGRAPKKVAA